MVKVDAIECTVDTGLWCHYDVANDVLYVRLASERATSTFAEETDDGLLLLRNQSGGEVVGITVVNWWKRFGQGPLPDSMHALEKAIEPWVKKLAA